MEKKILKYLFSALVNLVFLYIGFYWNPTILVSGVVVPWVLVCLKIIVLIIVLLVLYIFAKKLLTSLWKKFIKELKKELNIV